MILYSEAAYFDGNHCQHCADRDEVERLRRAMRQAWQSHRGQKALRDAYRVPYGMGGVA